MRFNHTEIKELLENEWDELTRGAYPADRLAEIADGLVPIYYSEIIKDWQEMPNEYTDNWKEQYGEIIPNEIGITALMTSDLWQYYSDTTTEIYHDILEGKEDN